MNQFSEKLSVLPLPRLSRLQRAACLRKQGEVEVCRMTVPDPAAHEVLVHIEGCGISASDLAVMENQEGMQYPAPGGFPGHEGWGVVEAVGSGVFDLTPGQRVTLLSHHAFAQYDIAPASEVALLPENLGPIPFPGEPLACAVNAIERAALSPGDTVAIVGIGFMGALLTALASRAGARVIAISRRPTALEMARKMGAAETVVYAGHSDVVDEVQRLTAGENCDCVIEAVGLQGPLDLAGELTRQRGKLVIVGSHQDGPRLVNMQMWNWNGLDVINAHERDPRFLMKGLRRAIDLVATCRLDPTPLYTHCFGLEELPEAFAVMRERPAGFMKALMVPHGGEVS